MNEFLDFLILILFLFAGMGLVVILIDLLIKVIDKPLNGKINEFLTSLFK